MNAKVAYDTFGSKVSGITEFEFDWILDSVEPEDANLTQIRFVLKGGLYEHLDIDQSIRSVVVLDGDVKDLIDQL